MYHCFARHENAYAAQDRWVTSEIAAHVVAAIQNARMLEHEQQVANERARLLQITEAATRTLDLSQVLQEIASATSDWPGPRAVISSWSITTRTSSSPRHTRRCPTGSQ